MNLVRSLEQFPLTPSTSSIEARILFDRAVFAASCVLRAFKSKIVLDLELNESDHVCGLIICNTATHAAQVVPIKISPGLIHLGDQVAYLRYITATDNLFNLVLREVAASDAYDLKVE